MAHPLLKLAAAYYPRSPVEKETMLSFFAELLAASAPLSENGCPVADDDLEKLVREGLAFGHQIKTAEPPRLAAIFAELGETELQGVRELVQSVVTHAGGTELSSLTATILEWHGNTNEWHGLKYYGQRLDRVVYCADFAIWIPWVL